MAGLKRAALSLVALLIAACATTSAPPAPGAYDLQSIALAITPDIAARAIEATQHMEVRVEGGPLRTLRFDANALTLRDARADGKAARWRVADGALLLDLPRAYRRGETIGLDLSYRGVPARGLTITDNLIHTSYFSCDWMVCVLDRPGDKARFTVTFAAPTGWTTLAASSTPESATYVMGFVSGRLTSFTQRVEDTVIVTASAHASGADLQAMFADSARMLAFFADKSGVAFPYARYVQLLAPGDDAQEGAGFAILGDEVVRPVLSDPHEDWAAAHEMAHMYWGNLVTCRDWTHFWLNEGLTTFMTAAWKEARWGEADYAREIALAQRRWDGAKSRGWDRPLAFSGAWPDLRTRRAIQYSKGMLFFDELRRTLGDEAFWNGLRAYTRRHAGGTVESADLQRAFEASSGRDLSALFNTWVYE